MSPIPARPDLARDLLDRAEQARSHRARLTRGLLTADAIGRGQHLEHATAQVLRRILADHGWPGADLVGKEAAEAAWWIILHADHLPDLQTAALRLLHAAAEKGQATPQQWAHLHDRCAIRSGQEQTYGTQYQLGPHGIEALPVRDPTRLDARRAGVGLRPAATALQHLRHRYARDPQNTAVRDEHDEDDTHSDLRRIAA
ncbi:DUF6624 domain-containing protein [Streptomyces flavofungini]|uniref:DUF6624 domain-containing protein n=1 Tax=Streptomyces flavofungini TaxID=68200 RepID=UPI0025AF7765|nr:DUF6624 domain-containing protein [Streptomyces flavofungini]WJV48888.1 hypothetical protein QUY26_27275 [Streptomyces flavofungini]